MKFKRTIFAFILFGILIFLLYAWEQYEEKKKEEELKAKEVFSFNVEEVDNITIKSLKGNISFLKDSDGVWNLTEPVKAKADSKVTSAFLSKLRELHFTRSFDVLNKDLPSYGLYPPKAEVTMSEGNKKISFLLGEETPMANSVYLKKNNDNKILMVENSIGRLVLRNIFDFRDKVVMRFDRKDVKKIELIYPEKSFSLLKNDQYWQMVKPLNVKANSDEVNGIFDLLLGLRVSKFEKEGSRDDQFYSFDKPSLKVLLEFNNGGSQSLILGKTLEEGVFSKVESEKEVYMVSSSILQDLSKTSFDLRNKKLAPFYINEIESFEISSKDKSMEIEKDLNGRWNIAEPVKAKGDMIEIQRLLYMILNLSFKEFIDDDTLHPGSIGLNPPEREIILRGKNKKYLVSIKIGKMDPNKYLNYAINDIENQLGMIDYTFVRDFLNFNLERLKEKQI